MKKLISAICLSLCVLFLASCGESSSTGDTKTTSTGGSKPTGKKYTITETFPVELNGELSFYYNVKDGSAPVTDVSVLSASVVIKDEAGTQLFEGAPEIVKKEDGLFLCKLDTNPLDLKASSPKGTAVCTLTAGSSQCESKVDLDCLPVDTSFIKLPALPLTVKMYGSNGDLQRNVTVETVDMETETDFGKIGLTLTFAGNSTVAGEYAGKYAGFRLIATQNGTELFNKSYTQKLEENGSFAGLVFRVRDIDPAAGDVVITIGDYTI